MFPRRQRKRLTMEERARIDQLKRKGWAYGAIAEEMGRPSETIRYHFDHRPPKIDGVPNNCECGHILHHDTDFHGYRVESCPLGCEQSPDLGYLMEFRVL